LLPAVYQAIVEEMRRRSAQRMRYTRNWLHYGISALVLLCAMVGAVENLLGR